jgi:hypothetical protein
MNGGLDAEIFWTLEEWERAGGDWDIISGAQTSPLHSATAMRTLENFHSISISISISILGFW